MPIMRILGIGIAVAGIVLLVLGVMATDTFGESWTKTFTGQYSDQTVWFIVGGSAGIMLGGVMALRGVKARV